MAVSRGIRAGLRAINDNPRFIVRVPRAESDEIIPPSGVSHDPIVGSEEYIPPSGVLRDPIDESNSVDANNDGENAEEPALVSDGEEKVTELSGERQIAADELSVAEGLGAVRTLEVANEVVIDSVAEKVVNNPDGVGSDGENPAVLAEDPIGESINESVDTSAIKESADLSANEGVNPDEDRGSKEIETQTVSGEPSVAVEVPVSGNKCVM